MQVRFTAAFACAAALVSAQAQAQPQGPAIIAPGPAPDYAIPDHWLCRPGHMAVCDIDLDATVIAADGRLRRERFVPARDPKVDCFVVYPTASLDPASNSDLVPGTQPGEEIDSMRRQFARFAKVCRLYAPMYRSTTVAQMRGAAPRGDRDLAYGDVLKAWRSYLANDNRGRGVVLIGHSQGAFHLKRLLAEEIDGKPDQTLILSAMLLGGGVSVRAGQDTGGDFKTMPLCRRADQIGCVIAYSTFRASAPPPKNAVFGPSPGPGLQTACANPAALGGGKAVLHPYFVTDLEMVPGHAPHQPWTRSKTPIHTGYVSTPGMLSGECRNDAHGSYLAISLNVRPADRRAHDIQGDVDPGGKALAEWGLHLVDVDVAMGDLMDRITDEIRAFERKRHD